MDVWQTDRRMYDRRMYDRRMDVQQMDRRMDRGTANLKP